MEDDRKHAHSASSGGEEALRFVDADESTDRGASAAAEGEDGQPPAEDPAGAEADRLRQLAQDQYNRGETAAALQTLREATRALRDSEDYQARGSLAFTRAEIEREAEMLVEAQRSFAEAAQAFALGRDFEGSAVCWLSVGEMRWHGGRFGGAREAYEQAADLFRQAGSELGQAQAIYRLAEANVENSPAVAARLYTQARGLYQRCKAASDEDETTAAEQDLPETVEDPGHLSPLMMMRVCERAIAALPAQALADAAADEFISASASRASVAHNAKRLRVGAGLFAAVAAVLVTYSSFSSTQSTISAPAAVPRPAGEPRQLLIVRSLEKAGVLMEAGATAAQEGEIEQARAGYSEAATMFEQAGDQDGQAQALFALAELEGEKSGQARQGYLESLSLYRQLGDSQGQARAIAALVEFDEASGDEEQLLESLDQALAVGEVNGDRAAQAAALQRMTGLHQRGGRLGEAREGLKRLRMLYDSAGDPKGKARTLERLIEIDLQGGRSARARDQLNQLFVLYREQDDVSGQARALLGLGGLDETEGRPEQARAALRQALRLYQENRDLGAQRTTRLRLGDVEVALGHSRRAGEIYGEVLGECEAAAATSCSAEALSRLGSLETASGELAAAIGLYERAVGGLDASPATADGPALVDLLASLATLEGRRGGKAAADAHRQRALSIAGGLPDASERADALVRLAAALEADGDHQAARGLYTRALGEYEKSRNLAGRIVALRALSGSAGGSDPASADRLAGELAALEAQAQASLRD